MSNECKNLLENDVDSYTEEQYAKMEKELVENINRVIKETENKYCVQPILETVQNKKRLVPTDVFILNKSVHNTFPFEGS